MTTTTANPIAAAALGKMNAARVELQASMIERDDEIDACLTALVAGENLLLVGPPGTGKSMLCDRVAELVHGTRFTYLMTKFTDPSEILGPVSLVELKAGRYVRVTAGKLPQAEVAFLDEVFKSSSAILNALLKILNEKTFDDGTGPKPVPLRVCIGASNEWPTGESHAELGALFDRFLIRRTVRPIQSADGKKRLRFGPPPAPLSVCLTGAELDAARLAAAALPWSAAAVTAYEEILRELAREGVIPGDRRDQKAVRVAQAAAWLDGADEVTPDHLGILADVLWDSPEEQPAKCRDIVAKTANPTGHHINSLLVEVEQIIGGVDPRNLGAVTAAAQKLSEVQKKLKPLAGNPKADKAIKYLEARVRALRTAAMDSVGT